MQRPPRVLPIHDDDATIARALESASVPTLMMSLVHLTGDASLLRGPIRPGRVVMGEPAGGLSDEASGPSTTSSASAGKSRCCAT